MTLQSPNPAVNPKTHPFKEMEGEGATAIDYEVLNARLRELDDLKNTFVALVSHELRTPANLIIGYLEVGIEQLSPEVPAETRRLFETAHRQASRLMRIVQELTDFAHLQRGDRVELGDPINVGESLVQVLSLLRPALNSKSIDPSVELPEELNTLKFDGESLIIIFRNLLSNAAKFTPANGKVWIKGVRVPKEDKIAIAVIDTAAPIPPEKRNTLFQDFRQMENYLTRRYEGLGLGLAVARRTAQSLGGDIQLQVRAEGNSFIVFLPIKERPENKK
jgi:signal transduction histidine kinase